MRWQYFNRGAFLRAMGSEIRQARLTRGLSREQLADRTGLHLNTIGIAERGDRDISCLAATRILLALGCIQLRFSSSGIVPILAENPSSTFCRQLQALPPPVVASRIGEAIRIRRTAFGLSIKKTAEGAGLHPNTLWNIEQGLIMPNALSLFQLYHFLEAEDLLPSDRDLRLL